VDVVGSGVVIFHTCRIDTQCITARLIVAIHVHKLSVCTSSSLRWHTSNGCLLRAMLTDAGPPPFSFQTVRTTRMSSQLMRLISTFHAPFYHRNPFAILIPQISKLAISLLAKSSSQKVDDNPRLSLTEHDQPCPTRPPRTTSVGRADLHDGSQARRVPRWGGGERRNGTAKRITSLLSHGGS